ncbi:MAG: CocE/NonD family hydrolase [Pseudomonadota bacterium]
MNDVTVQETVWITMPDGVRLAARIWMPTEAETSPVPAILEYIPYRRRDRTRLRDETMHPYFARAGYASVRVDIRGTGDSDGIIEDEYSEQEIQDGVDVVAWLAAQAWCDGSVGIFGKSWGAFSALQIASRRPPALKAIIPVMGTDDRWREDIHFSGGVLRTDNFWWGAIMQLLNALPPDPDVVGQERWRAQWKERLEAMTFWPAEWLKHQRFDDTWKRGSVSQDYGAIQVPVYFFGGWADAYRDTPFRLSENLSVPVKVLIGPWAHLYPHEGAPGPKVDFPAEATRFWDHWLKGIDTGLMDEPRMRVWMSDHPAGPAPDGHRPGRWVEETSWPSVNAVERIFFLNTGALDPSPVHGPVDEIASPQTFGSAGTDFCSFGVQGDLPSDCRVDAGGALIYRSAPLEEPIEILGLPQLELEVAADQPQGFVAVLLIDAAPDQSQTLITRGFLNLNHRESREEPRDVVPGKTMDVRVLLHAIGYRLAPGHRLMLHVASSYWPVLWPAPDPVALRIAPGRSRLVVPVRSAELAVPPEEFMEPATLPKAAVEQLFPGKLARSTRIDRVTGQHEDCLFIDGGVFGPIGRNRLTETDTTLGDVSERVYSIVPDDPLSAKATMEQRAEISRGDWHVTVRTYAEMTATRDAFLLNATTTCWDGVEEFHRSVWDHRIPRDGM